MIKIRNLSALLVSAFVLSQASIANADSLIQITNLDGTIDFGQVAQNATPAVMNLMVQNISGDRTVLLSSAYVAPGEYDFPSTNPFGFLLFPYGSISFQVRFNPAGLNLGPDYGFVSISAFDAADASVQDSAYYSLSAMVVPASTPPPTPTPVPAPLSVLECVDSCAVGPQYLDAPALTLKVRVTNAGSLPLSVNGVTPPAFLQLDPAFAAFTLGVGQSRVLTFDVLKNVTIPVGQIGAKKSGQIQFTTNEKPAIHRLSVSVQYSYLPEISVSLAQMAVPSVVKGKYATEASIDIHNVGKAPLKLTLGTVSAAFVARLQKASIPAGQSGKLFVKMNSAMKVGTYSGKVVITTNDPKNPKVVIPVAGQVQ